MARLAVYLLTCLLLAGALAAQIKVDVALVNVVATITDENGQYVADLTPDDLVVEEDGQLQTIAHFTQSRDIPVSIGILLDTSSSMEPKINTAKSAVERFIRTIRADDDAFLIRFSYSPVLQQNFTHERSLLISALGRISVSGPTALFDALVDGLKKIREGKHQKKAILLISDGDDTASYNSFNSAALAVRESEVLVYSLGIAPVLLDSNVAVAGPETLRGRPEMIDMNVLNALADSSGGKAWLVSGRTENRTTAMDEAFDEIAAELRNQYSIGYYPSHASDDGKWHRIQIRPRNPNHHIRSRREYFGGSGDCPYLPFFSPCQPVFGNPR